MTGARKLYDSQRFITEFTVTEDHLKLMKRAYVSWDDCEFGAPEIDCKRPYGNSDVLRDIAEIIDTDAARIAYDGEDAWEAYEQAHEEAFTRMHAETAIVLQIALNTGEFRAGRYVRERYGDWYRAA